MHEDRAVPTRLTQKAHQALRLAKRIGADKMGTFGEEMRGRDQFRDFAGGWRMAEHRQAERRLGDEQIARYERKRGAGRIALALVVAGDDGAKPIPLEQ